MFSENTAKPDALARERLSAITFNLGLQNKIGDFFNRYLIYWVLPLTILVLWHVLVQVGVITPRILPGPAAIVKAAVKLAASGELVSGILVSAARALTGLLVGGGIGFLLGLLNGMSPRSEKLLDTTIQMCALCPTWLWCRL